MTKVALILVTAALAPAEDLNLRDWLQRRGMEQLAARKQAVSAIVTREAAAARGQAVRAMLIEMIGGLPANKAPLALTRTVAVEREGYRIEKLIYQSQPNFHVTANLYVPTNRKGKLPAVLQPVGHSVTAKVRAFYQTLALGLVKTGMVVLTYDPLGQGERRVFYDATLGDSKVGGPTTEHQMLGVQSILAGQSIAREMIWDGIRSIDVLQTLEEVDGERIGVAGCSGGGTLTSYLAVIDERVKVAAPACYITDWESQLPGTGPQDAEQQFPLQLQRGLNHADFAIAFAPRPWLQVNTEEDFFPIAGARRTFEESQRIYSLFGAMDRVAMAVGPGGHGMPQNVREAIYGWMNRWLNNGAAGAVREPGFETEAEQTLWCTKSGQVSASLGGLTASDLLIARYSKIERPPADVSTEAGVRALRERLRREIARLTHYEALGKATRADTGPEEVREGYVIRRWMVTLPGGRNVAMAMAVPKQPRRVAILALHEGGSAESLKAGSDADALARLGYPVVTLDLAGFGASAGNWNSYSQSWFGPDKIAWLGMMTGKPLPGLGIEDIRAALDLLAEEKAGTGGVVALAKGGPGVALLHAAVLDERIGQVVIEEGLISFEAVVRNPIHQRVMTAVVPGVIGVYDLPDLASALAGRGVTLLNTKTPAGQAAVQQDVIDSYHAARSAFAGSGGEFRIGFRRDGEGISGFLSHLK
ncbi:MAG: acetylxylan esterase [Bryobacterales bacterium]|nr:acetylxylan esterase [Bryobacterales bacterium]